MNEQGRNRGVHAAGQPADHVAVADLLADPPDLLLRHRGGVPGHVTAADVLEEAGQYLRAIRGMDHLGVELDAIEAALRVLESGHRGLA